MAGNTNPSANINAYAFGYPFPFQPLRQALVPAVLYRVQSLDTGAIDLLACCERVIGALVLNATYQITIIPATENIVGQVIQMVPENATTHGRDLGNIFVQAEAVYASGRMPAPIDQAAQSIHVSAPGNVRAADEHYVCPLPGCTISTNRSQRTRFYHMWFDHIQKHHAGVYDATERVEVRRVSDNRQG